MLDQLMRRAGASASSLAKECVVLQVEDAVTALADVVKQARMAATEERVGAWTGMQEAEVTDRLLALVDETVETLDDEGRLRAQRRVDQDFESVRISS